MRVLVLSQYYYPEPVEKVHELVRGLVARGHEVQVLTSFPCYPRGRIYEGYRQRLVATEWIDGVEVVRVPQLPDHSASAWRRVAYYLSFCVSAMFIGGVVVRRADVLLVYGAALPASVAAAVVGFVRRIPVVHDVVDLWPESVQASGMLTNRMALRIIRWVARAVYLRAARVAVITRGYRAALVAMGIRSDKVEVVYHFLPALTLPRDLGAPARSGEFLVVYTGNMGPLQHLETVIEAAALVAEASPTVRFLLVGDGLEHTRLAAMVASFGLTNVELLGRVPPGELPAVYAAADALLLHLMPGPLSDISIPSKLMGYLPYGKPILAAVRGEVNELVVARGMGLAVPPLDPAALVAAITRLATMPEEERRDMGRAARRAHDEEFSSAVGIDKMEALLVGVAH